MKISDYLSREDISYFTSKSDLHAWRLLVTNWLGIALIFFVVATWTNPVTLLLAIPLLAGRQLGLSVLMHEAGHRTLFKTAALNDFFGQWFCALPVMNDLPSYASGHLEHHRKAGTQEDPDLPNYQAYPISSDSFRRKVIRDLSGQTGIKFMAYIFKGASGILGGNQRQSAKPFIQQIAVQVVLLLILAAAGIAWAYLLWAIAYLTFFMLIIRIRQVAEHAAVPNLFDSDPRMNTRTVEAPWWQLMLFAPNGVNYHMEHHFMASVPCYRLRSLRNFLKQRGALDEVYGFEGYGQVIRHAVQDSSPQAI